MLGNKINGIPNIDDSLDLMDCLDWPSRLHIWNDKIFYGKNESLRLDSYMKWVLNKIKMVIE